MLQSSNWNRRLASQAGNTGSSPVWSAIKKEANIVAYIYSVTNDINDKVYIGKTEGSVLNRFKEHCRDAFRERNEKRPLYSAMKKYGVEHFSVHVLEETDKPDEREQYWIDYYGSYRSGYNATTGGDGKRLFDYDKILDELILDSNTDRVATKIGCSVDTVRMVAHAHGLGVDRPVGANFGDVCERQKKPVIGYNKDFFVTFDSLGDAAAWLYDIGYTKSRGRCVRSHISECAKGYSKSAYKMKWSFLDGD